jgi:hypothetical protein
MCAGMNGVWGKAARSLSPLIPAKAGIQRLLVTLASRLLWPGLAGIQYCKSDSRVRIPARAAKAGVSSPADQLLNVTPVMRSRLPCQTFSLSAFGMSMPSMMRSVSRVYIVPFSGSNGQSEANTILSRS